MEINQKKSSNQTKFEFGDEKLKYTVKDASGKKTFTTEYGSISDDDFDELEEKNDWFRNVGILWILIGACLVNYLDIYISACVYVYSTFHEQP